MPNRRGRQLIGVALSCGFLITVALVAVLAARAARVGGIPVVPIVSNAAAVGPAVPMLVHGADLPHEHGAALLHPPPGGRVEGAECGCAMARQIDGWCPACGVGYVVGIEVPSPLLFEALDPHGHEIMPASIECPRCQDALRQDGFCDEHGWGFAHGLLYASRLTWGLANGRRAASTCGAECTADTGHAAWCEVGSHGRIGLRGLENRAIYEGTRRELERLQASLETLDRCESCAIARFMDARCKSCKIEWRNGHRVEAGTPPGGDRSREESAIESP